MASVIGGEVQDRAAESGDRPVPGTGKPRTSHGRPEITALTTVRGVAAWWVVLYHIRAALEGRLGPAFDLILGQGYLAVDLFFILSGFVIYLNYAPRVTTLTGTADFLLRRVARLYPLHAVMLLATLLYVLARLYRTGWLPPDYALELLPFNLLLVQNWGISRTLGWNVPAWSISTELFAYLLFPLLILVADPRRWPGWMLVAAIPALALLLYGGFASQGFDQLGAAIPRMGLLRCIVQFSMGAILCVLHQRLVGGRHGAGLGVWLLVAPLAMMGAAVLLAPAGRVIALEALVVPVGWSLLILGMSLLPPVNVLSWRPLVYVGEISYATYLSHYLAYIAFKLLFVREGVPVPFHAIALFLLAVLVLSVLLYRLVERPGQALILNGWRQWRSRRAISGV